MNQNTRILIAGLWAATGCARAVSAPKNPPEPRPERPTAPETPGPVRPGKPDRVPAALADTCRTRFAVRQVRPQELCTTVPGERGAWVPQPPLAHPFDDEDTKAKDAKVEEKARAIDKPELAARRGPLNGPGLCVYTWKADGADKRPPSPVDLARVGLAPDCAAVVTLATPDWKTIPADDWKEAARRSMLHARGVAGGEPWWDDVWGKGTVQVATIDTTPRAITHADPMRHGYGTTRATGALTCAALDDACRQRVRAFIGLPVLDLEGPIDPRGGRFGFLWQLGDALERVLTRWPAGERRVVNLSVGWDPSKFEPENPGVLYVRTQLERLSCRGALVLASAGNASGTSGPLLPAGWEVERAPDKGRCAELGESTVANTKGRYRPLVHAVGAVDARDQRLVTMRPWGQPRLAAYGQAVVGATKTLDAPDEQPIPLSGTSLATAIASGIAAAVWSQAPQLEAHQLADLLYASGKALDPTASLGARTEFCIGRAMGACGPYDTVRRISLCTAFRGLKKKVACEDAPPEADGPPPGDDPVRKAEVEKHNANRPDPRQGLACWTYGCGFPTTPYGIDVSLAVGPQDGVPYCPTCKLSKFWLSWWRVRGTPVYLPPGLSQTIVNTFQAGGPGATSHWITNPTTPGAEFTDYITSSYTVGAATLNWIYSPSAGVFLADHELLYVGP